MAGLDDCNVIDVVIEGPDGDIAFIISHDRPWTDSEDEIEHLRQKINTYAAYALDEGLVSAYPQSANRPKRIQLDCVTPPTPKVAELLAAADSALAAYSVRVTVNLLE